MDTDQTSNGVSDGSDITLRNCPFCGGEAKFEYSYPDFYKREKRFLGGVWVTCTQCPCELGRAGLDSQEQDCGAYQSFDHAAADWNSRA